MTGSGNNLSKNGRILVVDDNRLNRQKLLISLEQQGHTVGLAEDGQQALKALRIQPYDVVLLDILMPVMDGFEALQAMKRDPELRDIPVIVISAVDEIDSVVRCIEMGAEDYLQKPFNPVVLRARLNASLQRKQMRDLEKAYLEQEVMLRESERLATLGRLSAGMAHELNNPAAAAWRGASQVSQVFDDYQQLQLQVGRPDIIAAAQETVRAQKKSAQEQVQQRLKIDLIARSAREERLETWLEGLEIENAWETAPILVDLGLEEELLNELLAQYSPPAQRSFIRLLTYNAMIYALLEDISTGARRISEIVNGLKAYTLLDQAPVQIVDLNAALENTLAVLQNHLTPWVVVVREYDPDLPKIMAYGSQLNQALTNLISNALDAINGDGELSLRTCADETHVFIEIHDDGPGIPPEIQGRIFDPFFTTKPPGKGTGLGLNICHHIIVQKQHGRIDVTSKPGSTTFRVQLPRDLQPEKI